MKRLKLREEDNRIIGYGYFGNTNYPEYKWENEPKELLDTIGQPMYLWDGEKPVYSLIGYNDEQVEELRKKWCRKEIKAQYPEGIENKIIRENMDSILAGDGATDEYTAYTEAIKAIIAESKEKSFQEE